MKKAIIYCRVSSERQVKEGNGLDSQEKLCRNYAKLHDYSVVKVFQEEGVSGGVFDRPAMKELLKYLGDHLDDQFVIVFDDIKRFARDTEVHFALRRAITKLGHTVESPNFKFEDTPEGKYIETIFAATAELERNQNSKQVRNRMMARLQNGYWPFRSPPPGLRYQKEALHGKILRNEEPLASIYKEAIESYEKRLLVTLEDVQNFILQKYKETGLIRTLSLQGAKEILSELLYTGYIEHEKWKLPLQKGKHDGFISFETHNRVLSIIRDRGKIQPQRKDFNSDFPLRPYTLCTLCQKPMTAAWCRGRSNTYPKYWCKTKGCSNRAKTVPKSKIEGDFEPYLQGVAVNREMADLTEAIFLKTWKEEKGKELANNTAYRARMEELNVKIKNQAERVSTLKDESLIAVYEEQIKDWWKELKGLENNEPKINYSGEEFQTASDKVFGVLKEPVRMWKSKEYENKTTILQMYFERKLTYDLKTGFQTVRLAPAVELINSFGGNENTLVDKIRESSNQIEEYIWRWYHQVKYLNLSSL